MSTFVEDGWITGTVSQPSALKLKHIPGNPQISHTWVGLEPRRPAKQVTMMGRAEIVTDSAEIDAFMERRTNFYGTPARGGAGGDRLLVRVHPTLVRAEGFFADKPAGVALIRDFENPVVEEMGRGG